METTNTTTVESTHVCDCCHLVIANGDDSGCRDYSDHTHDDCTLGAEWFSDGCRCEDCDGECDYCETCDWHLESTPSWQCPGCGVTGVMFADMWRVSRFVG